MAPFLELSLLLGVEHVAGHPLGVGRRRHRRIALEYLQLAILADPRTASGADQQVTSGALHQPVQRLIDVHLLTASVKGWVAGYRPPRWGRGRCHGRGWASVPGQTAEPDCPAAGGPAQLFPRLGGLNSTTPGRMAPGVF